MVRTKVFVGNLSFSTKENELAKEFEIAGKVISANIITRGPRSLGYGFVEMDNETDASNAVKMLDKKEIDGRPINVEVAKPREEGADNAQSANAQGASRGGNGNRRRGPRTNNRGTDNTGAQQQQPRQNNQRSDRQQNQGSNTQSQQGGRRRRSDDQDGSNQQRQGGQRRPRPVRAEGEADTRTPSTTTLFVANLPFSIEDDSFAKILKDYSLAFKNAHVVKKRTGRSKGFGFIEFENEGDQQKALAALNNKEVEGRALAVKVALTEIKSDDINAAPAKTSSPAPTKNVNATPVKTSSPTPVKNSSPAPTKNTTTTTQPAIKEEKK